MLNSNDIEQAFELGRKDIDKVFLKFYESLVKEITDLLADFPEVKSGFVPFSVTNQEYQASVLIQLDQILQKAGYEEVANEMVRKNNDSITYLRQKASSSEFPFLFAPINQDYIQAFNEVFKQNVMRIPENAIEQVKMSVVQLTGGNINLKTAIDNVRNSLEKTAQRYSQTLIETSRRQIIQQIQDMSAQNYRDEGEDIFWEYVGPDDIKTRDECRWALAKRVFTDAEKKEFEAGGGFPHNEPRFNCRHAFVQISKNLFDKKINGANSRIDNLEL